MKTKWGIMIISSLLLTMHNVRAETDAKGFVTTAAIPRICFAVLLVEYPIAQGKIKETLGIPKYALLTSSTVNGGTKWIAALTDPSADIGYYAMRLLYRTNYDKLPAPDLIEILSIEIVFITPSGVVFVKEPEKNIGEIVAYYREEMRNRKWSPAEAAKIRFEPDLKKNK